MRALRELSVSLSTQSSLPRVCTYAEVVTWAALKQTVVPSLSFWTGCVPGRNHNQCGRELAGFVLSSLTGLLQFKCCWIFLNWGTRAILGVNRRMWGEASEKPARVHFHCFSWSDRPSTIEICGDRGKQVVTLTREAGLNCKCFALCDCDFTLFDLQHCHASPICTASPCFITWKSATSTCNAAMLQCCKSPASFP